MNTAVVQARAKTSNGMFTEGGGIGRDRSSSWVMDAWSRTALSGANLNARHCRHTGRVTTGADERAAVWQVRLVRAPLSKTDGLRADAVGFRTGRARGHRMLVKGQLTLRHGCAPLAAPGMTGDYR